MKGSQGFPKGLGLALISAVALIFLCGLCPGVQAQGVPGQFRSRIADLERENAQLKEQVAQLEKKIAGRDKIYDLDNDGRLSGREYEQPFKNAFMASLRAMDANRDRRLSIRELGQRRISKGRIAWFDRNRDGFVTEREYVGAFSDGFRELDQNRDGFFSFEDTGVVDSNRNRRVDREELQAAMNSLLKENGPGRQPRGYGYGPCGSPYLLCDPSCVRCIGFFIPRMDIFPWSGHATDQCTGFDYGSVCNDPWSEKFDPFNPCCD